MGAPPAFDVWHAFISGCCPLPEYTSARMQLHAGTPVGLAEGKGAPLHALMSSVAGLLLALDQLVVREPWNAAATQDRS